MTTEEIEARFGRLERGVRRWRIAALLFVAALIAAFTAPEKGIEEWTYWNLVKPGMADKYVEVRGG